MKKTIEERLKILEEALEEQMCIDCSVLHCWKVDIGYMAIGSTINTKPFMCKRKKRLHTWKEVKEETEL